MERWAPMCVVRAGAYVGACNHLWMSNQTTQGAEKQPRGWEPVTTGPTWTLDRLGVCAVATGLTIRPKTAPGEVMVSWGQTWWSVYVAAVGLQPQGFICPQVPAAGETGGPRAQLLGWQSRNNLTSVGQPHPAATSLSACWSGRHGGAVPRLHTCCATQLPTETDSRFVLLYCYLSPMSVSKSKF